MTSPKVIEVPVTSVDYEVYFFEVTDKVLEETGCMCANELRNLIASGEIHPFDIDGEWDTCDSEVTDVHYSEAKVC